MTLKDLNKHPWVQKVLNLFKQGLSADEMAKSIAMGALIGVIPLFGISTVTITAIAVRLKLNLPLSIFTTYAVGPLHLLLFIPFIKIGERIIGVEHTLFSFSAIKDAFRADYMKATKDLGLEILCGMTGWIIVAIPACFLLYIILRFLFSICWKAYKRK